MQRLKTAVVAAIITAGAFSANAEAAGMGVFYSSPFFRNQGREPAQSAEEWNRRRNGGGGDRDAYQDRARARKLDAAREAAREEAARLAAAKEAAQLAAAKRARLREQQQEEAEANAIAAKKAAAAQQAAASQKTATVTTNDAPAAKKEDRLPVAEASEPPTTATTTTASTTTVPVSDTAVKQTAPTTCRKYSAAADGMVDVPCN